MANTFTRCGSLNENSPHRVIGSDTIGRRGHARGSVSPRVGLWGFRSSSPAQCLSSCCFLIWMQTSQQLLQLHVCLHRASHQDDNGLNWTVSQLQLNSHIDKIGQWCSKLGKWSSCRGSGLRGKDTSSMWNTVQLVGLDVVMWVR